MTPTCPKCGREVCTCPRRKPLVMNPELAAKYRKAYGLDADNLPLNLSPTERKAALPPQEQAMPETQPTSSPTGTPFVAPHTIAFKVMGVLMAIAAAVAAKAPDLFPSTELDQQIAIGLVAIIGFLSPGLRRK